VLLPEKQKSREPCGVRGFNLLPVRVGIYLRRHLTADIPVLLSRSIPANVTTDERGFVPRA
jgi:hypothetical protein